MAKEKKGGKRMSKKQLAERLEAFFTSQPDKEISLKEIFRHLRLDTHPLKMLAIDIMEEMAWDDFYGILNQSLGNQYKIPATSAPGELPSTCLIMI